MHVFAAFPRVDMRGRQQSRGTFAGNGTLLKAGGCFFCHHHIRISADGSGSGKRRSNIVHIHCFVDIYLTVCLCQENNKNCCMGIYP